MYVARAYAPNARRRRPTTFAAYSPCRAFSSLIPPTCRPAPWRLRICACISYTLLLLLLNYRFNTMYFSIIQRRAHFGWFSRLAVWTTTLRRSPTSSKHATLVDGRLTPQLYWHARLDIPITLRAHLCDYVCCIAGLLFARPAYSPFSPSAFAFVLPYPTRRYTPNQHRRRLFGFVRFPVLVVRAAIVTFHLRWRLMLPP